MLNINRDNPKFHLALLNKIKNIEGKQRGRFVKLKSPLNGISAEFQPERNKFSIDFTIDLFDPNRKRILIGQSYKKLFFQTDNYNIILEDMFISTHGITNLTGTINQFYTKGYSKKKSYYYRIIIPIKKELDFHFYIKNKSFSSDLGYSSSLCTEVSFDGKRIELYSIKQNEKHYAVIDSNSKLSYASFSQIVFALLVSYVRLKVLEYPICSTRVPLVNGLSLLFLI